MTVSGSPSRYTAFGLSVASALPLPELPPGSADAEPDVTVELGTVPGELGSDGRPRLVFDDPREFTLVYPACRVCVSDGVSIVVDPTEGSKERDVRWIVLGSAFNFLLHQRGHLVLHGSTVGVDGVAVAFVGASGAGKSTLAAAFVDASHRALADDIVAVRVTETGPVVRPGFASLKLDDAAAAHLADGLAPVADGGTSANTEQRPANTERFYRVGADDSAELPLGAVYRVLDGDELSITPLSPAAAAIELARNAYTIGTHGRREEASLALDRSVAVASAVPVARLERPREFASLGNVVRAVEDDLDRERKR